MSQMGESGWPARSPVVRSILAPRGTVWVDSGDRTPRRIVIVARGAGVSDFSVPADFHIPDDANLTDAIVANAAEHPDLVVFDRKVDGA